MPPSSTPRVAVRRLVGGAECFVSVDLDAPASGLVSELRAQGFCRLPHCSLFVNGTELSLEASLRESGVGAGSQLLLVELRTAEARPPPPISTCHPLYQQSFRALYSSDKTTVLRALRQIRETVRATPEARAAIAHGHGLDHVLLLLERQDDDILRGALKLLLSAAVSDAVERLLFAKGAIVHAMHYGRITQSLETRRAAITLFFNLCFNEATREQVIDQGGFDFIAEMITSPDSFQADGEAKPVALQAVKALLLLIHAPELRDRVWTNAALLDAICTHLAACPDPRIQDRAAKLLRVLLNGREACATGARNPSVCSALYALGMARHRYAQEAVLVMQHELGEAALPPMLRAVRGAAASAGEADRRRAPRPQRIGSVGGPAAAASMSMHGQLGGLQGQ